VEGSLLPNYRLVDAVRFGLPMQAKEAIDRGADTNFHDDGLSLLQLAEKHHANEVAGILITAGANTDELDKNGDTLLHRSARRGNFGFAHILLEHGVSPNVQNHKGETPLHLAARAGFQYFVKTLLARGADPDIRDNAGRTAATYAFLSGESACEQLLNPAPSFSSWEQYADERSASQRVADRSR